MLNIKTGKIPRARRVVLYGVEGIGKTTLASRTPNPLVIDTENGSANVDVRRVDGIGSWEELTGVLKEIAASPGVCKTCVLDTIDRAEQLAVEHVLQKYGVTSIESFGYGKGYTYIAEEIAKLLKLCDAVAAGGIHMVVTAHARTRKIEQPDEMGAYDHWELKLSRQSAPLVKEWCDDLLFCNYRTVVVTAENGVRKAQGAKRVIYTAHAAAYDAKNRAGLPETLDMCYESIAPLFEYRTPREEMEQRMRRENISPEQLRAAVESRGQCVGKTADEYTDTFIGGWVLKYWDKLAAIAKGE